MKKMTPKNWAMVEELEKIRSVIAELNKRSSAIKTDINKALGTRDEMSSPDGKLQIIRTVTEIDEYSVAAHSRVSFKIKLKD